MKNIMTIDMEEYFQGNLCPNKNDGFESTLKKDTMDMLELLKKYNVYATFFVVGENARRYPNLIKKIDKEGHYISSHYYQHELLYKKRKEEFKKEVLESKKVIEKIIGHKIYGFRAPSWSISKENLWMLEVLEQNGFHYSSSIFPAKNFLYGIINAPIYPNHPVVNQKVLKLYEFPPGVFKIFKNIGFSGGFWFRLFPYFMIKYMIKRKNKKNIPVVCYLHTWEINQNLPRYKTNFINNFVCYFNLSSCRKKFERLLNDFDFCSIEEYIDRTKNEN